jgi:hypothetical protein
MPLPEEPFLGELCVFRSGEHSCPAGWTAKHTGWEDFADSRGCATCSCGAPGGATCEGRIEGHQNSACSNLGFTIDLPGLECVVTEDTAPLSAEFVATGTLGGSCTPSGGNPTGELTGSEPVTICCSTP